MNERMKSQLEALDNHKTDFSGTSEEKQRLLEKVRKDLESGTIDVDDLMDISLGYDISLKSLLMMAYTPYHVIFDDTILDCIKRDDLKSLLFISSVCIMHHEGRFYTVNANFLKDHNEISEDVMNQLREYLLKKGHPLHARAVSAPDSFCRVNKLSEAACAEDVLMKYVFLAGGKRFPHTDELTISFFNQLDENEKEYILDQLISSYQNFKYDKVDSTAIAAEDPAAGLMHIIQKADFDALESESEKKNELIALQEKIFG